MSNWDLTGYIAAGLVLTAFYMKDMVPLQLVALCSNLAFITLRMRPRPHAHLAAARAATARKRVPTCRSSAMASPPRENHPPETDKNDA